MAALQAHDWPGNVRQLRKSSSGRSSWRRAIASSCIEVDLLAAGDPRQSERDGRVDDGDGDHGQPAARSRESFEREYLKIQIRRFSGNISRTASFIGMERSALHRKLKALGIGDKREGEE